MYNEEFMNVEELQVLLKIKQHLELSDEEILVLQQRADNFFYPLGICPIYTFHGSNLRQYTFAENYEYIMDIVSRLYINIYNEEELQIIVLYIIFSFESGSSLNRTLIDEYLPVLNLTSEHEEIQYCLYAIKYYIVQFLVYSPIVDNIDLINTLLTELSPIEEEFNLFNLTRPKNESY